jgi:aspartate/methionine/tyrosine aminotransferase
MLDALTQAGCDPRPGRVCEIVSAVELPRSSSNPSLSASARRQRPGLPWLDAFLEHLLARRDQCVSTLKEIGSLDVESPDATYVFFPKIKPEVMRFGESIEMLVDRIKSECKVSIVPGSPRWFGEGAAGHVRLCFATSEGILAEGLRRFASAF